MTKTIPAFTALFLAGAAPATAQPATYRAVGTEPFWSVTITPRQMRYETPAGRAVTVATPRPAHPRPTGRIYSTSRLRVSIRTAPCSDGMSDRTYADTVDVTVDGRELHGCGGGFVEAVNLTNTNWRITAINGLGVPADGRYQMEYTEDRLSGRAGCNSFSGPYRLDGRRLHAGPLMSTRMACFAGAAMRNEAAALEILGGPVTISRPREQALELRGAAGSISLRIVPGPRPRG